MIYRLHEKHSIHLKYSLGKSNPHKSKEKNWCYLKISNTWEHLTEPWYASTHLKITLHNVPSCGLIRALVAFVVHFNAWIVLYFT